MATIYSDIFVNGVNSEEFYIEGSQIKEAWLNGQCIWALAGGKIVNPYAYGYHRGFWYCLYSTESGSFLGRGEEPGIITESIPYDIRVNTVMHFLDEGILIDVYSDMTISYKKIVNYDLQTISKPFPSKVYTYRGMYGYSGMYYFFYNSTSRTINVRDTTGTIVKTLNGGYMSTDGQYIYYYYKGTQGDPPRYVRLNVQSLVTQVITIDTEQYADIFSQKLIDSTDWTKYSRSTYQYSKTAVTSKSGSCCYYHGKVIYTNELRIAGIATNISTGQIEFIEAIEEYTFEGSTLYEGKSGIYIDTIDLYGETCFVNMGTGQGIRVGGGSAVPTSESANQYFSASKNNGDVYLYTPNKLLTCDSTQVVISNPDIKEEL